MGGLTFCPWRFRSHSGALPGAGRGSDSSPDASMSEEKYWVLLGEGKEESESPSLATRASSPLLPIWSVVVSGSSRNTGLGVGAPERPGPGRASAGGLDRFAWRFLRFRT